MFRDRECVAASTLLLQMAVADTTNVYTLSTHPLFFDIIQITTIALVVGFTFAKSRVRLLALPLVLSIPRYVVPRCRERVQGDIWSGIVGSTSVFYCLTYIDLALLGKWCFESHGPSDPSQSLHFAKSSRQVKQDSNAWHTPGRSSLADRLHFGFSSAFNPRMIGTPWEVKGVPPFSAKDNTFVPTRAQFLLQTCLRLLTVYLVLDLLTAWGDPDKNPVTYSLDLVPFFRRLGEVTVEQLVIRLITTIALWTSIYCIMTILYSVVSLIAVLSGASEARSWPPVYGSLSNAYTIRRFWG